MYRTYSPEKKLFREIFGAKTSADHNSQSPHLWLKSTKLQRVKTPQIFMSSVRGKKHFDFFDSEKNAKEFKALMFNSQHVSGREIKAKRVVEFQKRRLSS